MYVLDRLRELLSEPDDLLIGHDGPAPEVLCVCLVVGNSLGDQADHASGSLSLEGGGVEEHKL